MEVIREVEGSKFCSQFLQDEYSLFFGAVIAQGIDIIAGVADLELAEIGLADVVEGHGPG